MQVYEAVPPRRQRAARCFGLDDHEACLQLADLLEQAHENLLAGGPGLDWQRSGDEPSASEAQTWSPEATSTQSWGEIRALIKADIAPGGPKARDRNPFVCFGNKGFFGLIDAHGQSALPEHLETFCLHTPESIRAHRADPTVALVPIPWAATTRLLRHCGDPAR